MAALVLPVTHSWNPESSQDQEECHRVTVFASKNPQNAEQWFTVLSGYYFGGNGEWISDLGVAGPDCRIVGGTKSVAGCTLSLPVKPCHYRV